MTIHIGEFRNIVEDSIRVTEDVNTRITESGDIRITVGVQGNSGISTLIVNSTLIPFVTGMFVKYLTNWKLSTAYVKYNSSWVLPENIYINQNGNWKRVL